MFMIQEAVLEIKAHGLQKTDKSRITESRIHGKSYKLRMAHSRKYGFFNITEPRIF